MKLALWVTRGCDWIHVGRSVCKLAGLKAQSDHQNPRKVALQGKTAFVGLLPQLVDRFTPFLLQWCLFIIRTLWHQKPCDLVMWVACYVWWKIGFTPQAIRPFCQYRQHSSSGANLWELSEIVASLGHHTSHFNTPLWGLRWPPLERPSEWLAIKSQKYWCKFGNLWSSRKSTGGNCCMSGVNNFHQNSTRPPIGPV